MCQRAVKPVGISILMADGARAGEVPFLGKGQKTHHNEFAWGTMRASH